MKVFVREMEMSVVGGSSRILLLGPVMVRVGVVYRRTKRGAKKQRCSWQRVGCEANNQ
jgi:hypothetical protein